MSEDFLTPEARDYLADLARGDERALQLEEIHEKSVEVSVEILKLAAEHHAACKVADFRRAEVIAGVMAETVALVARAHRATIGKPT